MQGISKDSYNYTPIPLLQTRETKDRSERESLLKQFVEGVNAERPCKYVVNGKTKTLGKITGRAVAIKLGHIKKLSDLYFLLSLCNDAKNRGGSFSHEMFRNIKIK